VILAIAMVFSFDPDFWDDQNLEISTGWLYPSAILPVMSGKLYRIDKPRALA
jgi:hypothetical protein